jgi:hypothetical protein
MIYSNDESSPRREKHIPFIIGNAIIIWVYECSVQWYKRLNGLIRCYDCKFVREANLKGS